eukprot:2472925-Amphidinium_carterae.2
MVIGSTKPTLSRGPNARHLCHCDSLEIVAAVLGCCGSRGGGVRPFLWFWCDGLRSRGLVRPSPVRP